MLELSVVVLELSVGVVPEVPVTVLELLVNVVLEVVVVVVVVVVVLELSVGLVTEEPVATVIGVVVVRVFKQESHSTGQDARCCRIVHANNEKDGQASTSS